MLASAFLEDFRNGNYNQLLNDLYDDESLVAYQQSVMPMPSKNSFVYLVTRKYPSLLLPVVLKFPEIILIISMAEFWLLPSTSIRSQLQAKTILESLRSFLMISTSLQFMSMNLKCARKKKELLKP